VGDRGKTEGRKGERRKGRKVEREKGRKVEREKGDWGRRKRIIDALGG
jgi:hypothetical protein